MKAHCYNLRLLAQNKDLTTKKLLIHDVSILS
jgi:hypothetical protein